MGADFEAHDGIELRGAPSVRTTAAAGGT